MFEAAGPAFGAKRIAGRTDPHSVEADDVKSPRAACIIAGRILFQKGANRGACKGRIEGNSRSGRDESLH